MEQNFWEDKSRAEKVLKEKKLYEDLVNSYESSLKQFNELSDLYDLALEENNQSVLKESEKNIFELHKNIKFLVIDQKSGKKADFGSKTTIIEAYKKTNLKNNLLVTDDLIPASSPLCSLINSHLLFLFDAHFIYILLNISAQSWLSVPPAPA